MTFTEGPPDSIDTIKESEEEPNELGYPFGYFDAQVQFAQKWASLTGKDFSKILLSKTALYRRIFNKKAPTGEAPQEWQDLLQGVDGNDDHNTISQKLFTTYASMPESKYTPPEHASAFGYNYDKDRMLVKIHFDNPVRGESPFAPENMPKLREQFKQMLEDVQANHPDAQTLMSASWVRSTKSYRSLSPEDIAPQVSLMSPGMAFGGNSLWGQFLDKNGQVNQRVYNQFVAAIAQAKTIEDLVAAFPYQVLKAEDPTSKYYEYYGIAGA